MQQRLTAHNLPTSIKRWWGICFGCMRPLLPCLNLLLSLSAQVSESPTTVQPGQWLLEADVVAVAFDRHTVRQDSMHYRSTTLGATTLSTGLNEKFDVQFGLELWREEQTTGAGLNEQGRGRGDSWLRCQWNFSGNETLGPAWALLPYLKLPLADEAVGNGRTEPGVALIYGRPLDGERVLNAMLGVDWLEDGPGRRAPAYFGSVAVTWSCGVGTACYVETIVSVDDRATRDWTGEFGAGLTWATKAGVSFDLAVYAGLTRSSPDWTPVFRLVWPL
jgi:hypothetical protein